MPYILYWTCLLKPQLLKPCPQLIWSNLYCLRIKLVSSSSSSMSSLVVFQEQVRRESLSGEAYPCFTNKKGWFSLSITFSLSEILGSLSWNFCNSLPTFCCWPLSGIVLCLLIIFAVCFRISPLLNMTSLFSHLWNEREDVKRLSPVLCTPHSYWGSHLAPGWTGLFSSSSAEALGGTKKDLGVSPYGNAQKGSQDSPYSIPDSNILLTITAV